MRPGKFEIYFAKDYRFSGVYYRDNLPKTKKDGTYEINFDKYADIGTH